MAADESDSRRSSGAPIDGGGSILSSGSLTMWHTDRRSLDATMVVSPATDRRIAHAAFGGSDKAILGLVGGAGTSSSTNMAIDGGGSTAMGITATGAAAAGTRAGDGARGASSDLAAASGSGGGPVSGSGGVGGGPSGTIRLRQPPTPRRRLSTGASGGSTEGLDDAVVPSDSGTEGSGGNTTAVFGYSGAAEAAAAAAAVAANDQMPTSPEVQRMMEAILAGDVAGIAAYPQYSQHFSATMLPTPTSAMSIDTAAAASNMLAALGGSGLMTLGSPVQMRTDAQPLPLNNVLSQPGDPVLGSSLSAAAALARVASSHQQDPAAAAAAAAAGGGALSRAASDAPPAVLADAPVGLKARPAAIDDRAALAYVPPSLVSPRPRSSSASTPNMRGGSGGQLGVPEEPPIADRSTPTSFVSSMTSPALNLLALPPLLGQQLSVDGWTPPTLPPYHASGSASGSGGRANRSAASSGRTSPSASQRHRNALSAIGSPDLTADSDDDEVDGVPVANVHVGDGQMRAQRKRGTVKFTYADLEDVVQVRRTERLTKAQLLHRAADQIVDMQSEETEARRRLQAMRDQIRAVKNECEALISQLDLDGETMQAALFRRKLTHATGGL